MPAIVAAIIGWPTTVVPHSVDVPQQGVSIGGEGRKLRSHLDEEDAARGAVGGPGRPLGAVSNVITTVF